MDDKNLYNIFKESSETSRNVSIDDEGWEHLTSRLDEHDGKKKRRLLGILPWFLVGVFLVSTVSFMMKNQELSHHVQKLTSEVKPEKFTPDTIIQIETIYVRDTFYAAAPSVNIKNNELKSTEHSSLYALLNSINGVSKRNKLSFYNQSSAVAELSTYNLNNPNSANILNYQNTLFENNISKKYSNSLALESSQIATISKDSIMKNDIEENSIEALESIQMNVDIEEDSLLIPIALIDSMIETATSNYLIPKIVYALTPKKYLLGLNVGGIFPLGMNNGTKSRGGYNLGISATVPFSEQIHSWTDVSFSKTRFSSTELDTAIGIPLVSIPNDYTFETANLSRNSITWTIGLKYMFLPSKKWNPYVAIGYGGSWELPYSVEYSFTPIDLGNDIKIEAPISKNQYIKNHYQLGAGLNYQYSNQLNLNIEGRYRSQFNSPQFNYFDFIGINFKMLYRL